MNLGSDDERELITVPLQRAVFCVDCEIVSNSPHDVCTVCGSPSLINLDRLLGGTILSRGVARPFAPERSKSVKYNLELTIKAYDIAARDLNNAVDSITQLAAVAGKLECLHLNVESVEKAVVQGLLKAA
jgi:hypothetical protein